MRRRETKDDSLIHVRGKRRMKKEDGDRWKKERTRTSSSFNYSHLSASDDSDFSRHERRNLEEKCVILLLTLQILVHSFSLSSLPTTTATSTES